MSQSVNTAHVTYPAPGFTAQALLTDRSFGSVSLSDYKGKYVVLFFYPLNFTFVCPTEIHDFSDRENEFNNINCQIIAASIDSHFSHLAWVETPRNKGGLGSVNYPIIGDISHELSKAYGVYLPEAGHTLRGLFIIDGKGILRHATFNDPPVGRNVSEVLRLVQAYQYVDEHGEVCPSGWTPGKKTIDTNNKLKFFEQAHQ